MEHMHSINEICYIYCQRNSLGKERDKMRYKLKYLLDIKRAIKADGKDTRNPIPRTFRDTTKSQINLIILEAQRSVLSTKISVMKHTSKYQKRLSILINETNCHPVYSMGLVANLNWYNNDSGPANFIDLNAMKTRAIEFELSKSIHDMIRK